MSQQLVLPDLVIPAVKKTAVKKIAVKTPSVKTITTVKTPKNAEPGAAPRIGHQLDRRTRERGLRGVEEARRALAAAVEHQHIAA